MRFHPRNAVLPSIIQNRLHPFPVHQAPRGRWVWSVVLALWLAAFGAVRGEDLVASIAADRDDGRPLAPEELRVIDGKVYFAGNLSNSGIAHREPGLTRGTSATSILLRDIQPGPSVGSEPAEFTKAGAYVFFAATDATNGRELWRTDGTPDGTVLVKNIRPGPNSSSPTQLIECDGKLLFYADDGTHNAQLWISDGTEDGTKLLKQIGEGVDPYSANVSNVFNWNGVVYFSARNHSNNSELWRSDGTEAGTYLLKDIASSSSDPGSFVVFKGALYFQANSSAEGAAELWRTDGTAGGTVLVKALGGTNGFSSPTVVGDLLFFSAPLVNHEDELWRSDGTEAGTFLVKVIDPRSGYGSDPHDLVNYNGTLYFVASDAAHGEQIWKSDGTEAGTVMVHEIYNPSGIPVPQPNSLMVFDGKLLFRQTRRNFSPMEWWQTDGTDAGLKVVLPAGHEVFSSKPGGYGAGFVIGGSALYFSGYDSSGVGNLWKLTVPLTITTPPVAQLVARGAAVTLSVAASPSADIDARWLKGGVQVATGLSLTIDAAQLADAGVYVARLSSPNGGVDSPETALGVVDRVVPDAQVAEGGKLVFEVHAAGPGLIYRWKRDGANLSADDHIKGVTTPQLTISHATAEDAHTYTCEVRMGALTLTTLPATAVIVTPPVVDPQPPPAAIVAGGFTWQLGASQSPSTYKVSGLPAGLVFDPATGLVSGVPKAFGTFNVRVSARNAAGYGPVVVFSFTVAPLPAGQVGEFGGLIARNAGLDGNLGGSLSVKVAALGSFSGQVKLGASSAAFKGSVVASLSGNATATVAISRKGLPALTLSLVFDPTQNSLAGTITDGTNTAAINARRQIWGAKGAASYAGKYNVALDASASVTGHPTLPQGIGWAQLAVAASGRIKLSGATATGETLSGQVPLWPDGSVPIFVCQKGGHSSLHGLLRISLEGAAPAYADSRIDSTGLSWQKTSRNGASDRVYAGGFDAIPIAADGSKWVVPVRGENVLAVPERAGNARLEFREGGIGSAAQAGSLDQTFELTAKNLRIFDAAANPCRVSLSVNASTGKFTGKFTFTDANPRGGAPLKRPALYSGVFLRHRVQGWGYFLLPGLPASADAPPVSAQPILSGSVQVSSLP